MAAGKGLRGDARLDESHESHPPMRRCVLLGAFTTDGRPTAALDAFGDGTSGIQTLSVEQQPIHYYDLQGHRLCSPSHGLVIEKKGKVFHKRIY